MVDSVARGQSRRGLILLAMLVVIWGTVWPVHKALLDYMTPLWSIAIRTYVSVLALFAISVFITGLVPPARQDMPVLVSMSLLHMVGFTIFSTLALKLAPAGRSAVLAYTSVLWAPVGAALFLGEKLPAARILGLGLGLAGLVVIFNPLTFDWNDRNAVLSSLSLLLAAVLWASSIVHIRGHAWHGTPLQLAPWQLLLAAAIVTIVAYAIEGAPRIAWTANAALLLLFAGIPGSALAYWLAAVSSSELPAATTSLGLLGVPAISVAMSLVMLGERPPLSLLVALALILVGVVVGFLGSVRGK